MIVSVFEAAQIKLLVVEGKKSCEKGAALSPQNKVSRSQKGEGYMDGQLSD